MSPGCGSDGCIPGRVVPSMPDLLRPGLPRPGWEARRLVESAGEPRSPLGRLPIRGRYRNGFFRPGFRGCQRVAL